jgi:hypothetical protein
MSKISFREFRANFNAELLINSLDVFKVGHKAEYERRIPEVEPTYFTDFIDISSDDEKFFEDEFDKLNNLPYQNANFGNLEIDRGVDIKPALKIPSAGLDLGGRLDFKKISSFSYEEVKAKSLVGTTRSKLINKIDDIKKNDRRHYRKIKHIMFVDVLYYAKKVSITVEKEYEISAKAILTNIVDDLQISVVGETEVKITFSNHDNVPFAAKFETIQDLIS